MNTLSGRRRAALFLGGCALLLCLMALSGWLLFDRAALTDLSRKHLPPSLLFPFGTDQLGRNMLARTLSGLSLSLGVGLLTALISALIALMLGLCSTLGRRADALIGYVIDLTMGVPHILLLILFALAFGRGLTGVTAALCLTHWPSLARLLRGEVLSLRERTYLKVAQQLGSSRWTLVRRHYLPHLLPQFLTGAALILPHAVLHESALTFLGFGLSPETPAIGVILSESMGYLAAGRWWLALFPGLLLVAAVALFSAAGRTLRRLTDPGSIHQ